MTLKTLALTAATVALTAGAASANSFGFQENVMDRNSIELDLVTASADGVVEIYDLRGDLLGATMVNAGANDDVRINIGNGYKTDIVAVLKVGAQEVASETFDVIR